MNPFPLSYWSRESLVGIATGYGLEGWGSIPSRSKSFLYFTVPRPTLRLTQPPIKWVSEALFPGYSGQGVNLTAHLHPVLGIKNGGAIPPLSHGTVLN
jgi:hypothetical protein